MPRKLNVNFNLSAPWVTYYRKLEALFGKDPDIRIEYDEGEIEVKMYVENAAKADAIAQLLPTEKTFGSVVLKTTVIPANKPTASRAALIATAFEGNPAYSYGMTIDGVSSNSFNYVVFKNEVVQFYNDQLNDINGNVSTLYQDIAKEVLGESEGIYFCTDLPK